MVFDGALMWILAFLAALGMNQAAALTLLELMLALGAMAVVRVVVVLGESYAKKHVRKVDDWMIRDAAKLLGPGLSAVFCLGLSRVVPDTMQGHILAGAAAMMVLWVMIRALRILPGPKFLKTVVGVVVTVLLLLLSVSSLRPIVGMVSGVQFTLGGLTIQLQPLLEGIFYLCLLSWLAVAGTSGLSHVLEKNSTFSATLQAVVVKVFKFCALLLAIMVALSVMGVNVSNLAIFGGALAIGIGWSLRPITSNLLSGFLLLMDRSIKPGDVISLDDQTFGQVKALHSRYVVLRRRDGKEVLIPNEVIMNQPVINWSYTNKAVRAEVNIPVDHDNDMEQVQAILKEAIGGVPRVQTVPAPIVFIKEFAEHATIFIVRYWSVDPEQGVNNLKGDVNMACWKALKANGISIPRGQMVVHMADTGERRPAPARGPRKAAAPR